ncbi:hypothetical protein C8J57DRAFT_1056704, partial [Mycena rebaudengoi]
DAAATEYAFEWNIYVPVNKPHEKDTSFSHRNVKMWAECLSWYTDPASHGEVYRIEQETLVYFRSQYDSEEEVTYQNWSRDVPLKQLYQGPENLARLRALRKE